MIKGAAERADTGVVLRLRVTAWTGLTRAPTVATQRGVAFSTGVMFLAGGALAGLSTLLPGGPEAAAVATEVRGLGAGGLLIGGGLLMTGARLPRWTFHLVLVLAWAMVTRGVLVAGGGPLSYGYALLYLLIVINAFTACSWLGAGGHLVLALAGTVGLLTWLPDDRPSSTLVLGGVLVMTCLFVGRLIRAAAAAEVDALTGLVNRRGLDRHLEQALARAQRLGSPVSLAVVDLDHFKRVNDEHGHSAGDQLLRSVAQSWAAAVPPEVVLARSGGDEFVLLRCDTGTAELAVLLDHLRRHLPPGTTCSAGTARWRPGESASSLTSRADTALYDAKRTARGSTRSHVDTLR